MSRPQHYPDSRIQITSPFFLLSCSCGLRNWSLLGEITSCPNCGRLMKLDHGYGLQRAVAAVPKGDVMYRLPRLSIAEWAGTASAMEQSKGCQTEKADRVPP